MKKYFIQFTGLMFLSFNICEARIEGLEDLSVAIKKSQHTRNVKAFGDKELNLYTFSNQIKKLDNGDFLFDGRCENLIKHYDKMKNSLLKTEEEVKNRNIFSKTVGYIYNWLTQTENELIAKRKEFYKELITLVEQGGDYRFGGNGYNACFKDPDHGFLVSHKLKVLKDCLEVSDKFINSKDKKRAFDLYTMLQENIKKSTRG
ncbi:MAG TPA: hypothetical protein VI959_01300 [Alphaproteobacteria bacterium]|nr:hypothetical protein [Alphaproteobacteria bacterium]